MTKQQRIADIKRRLALAEDLERVANQNKEIATRIVSELKSALDEMGVQKGRLKKQFLTDEDILSIEASLTK